MSIDYPSLSGVASAAPRTKLGPPAAGAEMLLLDALNLAALAEILTQPRTWELAGVVAIGGVVRGFSGFGGALIFIPLASALVGPRLAIPIFYLVDLVTALPYGLRMIPRAELRQVAPMLAGSWMMAPFGAWVLIAIEPDMLRWFTSLMVIAMVGLLASGWRYGQEPRPLLSLGVGATGGALGTATGISGPVIIAYFLGSRSNAETIRANIMVFYALAALGTDAVFLWNGLFTLEALAYALAAAPLYAAGLTLGARVFGRSSDKAYRRAAFAIITVSAIVGMPAVSGFFR